MEHEVLVERVVVTDILSFDNCDSKYQDNPFFSATYVNQLVGSFHTTYKMYLIKICRSDNLTDYLLMASQRPFVISSFLPPQAQISLSMLKELSVGNVHAIFSKFPFCFKIDIFALDSKYTEKEKIMWPYRDITSHATTMSIDTSGDFEKYWASRSKKLKKNTMRYNKRITSEGVDLELAVHLEKARIEQAVNEYGHLESAGWKGEAGTALHPENSQGEFYKNVLSTAATNGCAVVFELYFGEELVASRLGLMSEGTIVMLKTTYDEKYKKYAVGRLLLHRSIEYCFDKQGINTIEFYTNASADQLSWATNSRDIYHVTLYRNAVVSKLHKIAQRVKKAIKNI